MGGDFAPLEAYCDGKSCPHTAARREVKLGISPALIAEFADRCTKVEHISAAFHSLEIDWPMGRHINGLGVREGNEPFPFKLKQLRDYAPSTPARRLNSHGKARARREALPAMRTSTALLRRAEPSTAGLWPRASALLARQALEAVLADLWNVRAPGLERCPMRAQLLCVEACLPKRGDLAARVRYAWAGLSRACHQHPYELPPTLSELTAWVAVVEDLRNSVQTE